VGGRAGKRGFWVGQCGLGGIGENRPKELKRGLQKKVNREDPEEGTLIIENKETLMVEK